MAPGPRPNPGVQGWEGIVPGPLDPILVCWGQEGTVLKLHSGVWKGGGVVPHSCGQLGM